MRRRELPPTLEASCGAAIEAAIPLPEAERAAFIGAHLLAQSKGAPPPKPAKASTGGASLSRDALQEELTSLAAGLTVAVNKASRMPGPVLQNLANHLLNHAGAPPAVNSRPAAPAAAGAGCASAGAGCASAGAAGNVQPAPSGAQMQFAKASVAPPEAEASPAPPAVAQTDYAVESSIWEGLEGDDVLLLSGKWLAEFSEREGAVLPRRMHLAAEHQQKIIDGFTGRLG